MAVMEGRWGMNFSRPFSVITPTLDGDVLAVLAGTTRPLTGRQVAQLSAQGSPDGVRKALARLVGQGIVHVDEAGSALLYTLNRDHVAAPAVLALADLRAELRRRIAEEVARWPLSPVHLSLFGSVARGEARATSDIDLLVVHADDVDTEEPIWRQQLEQLRQHVRQWAGNPVGYIELSVSQLAQTIRDREAIVAEWRHDAITLAGAPLPDLLRELA